MPLLPHAHKGHLCFVAPEAWPVLSGAGHFDRIRGAEIQQCILARALAGEGYRVSMITLDHGQPDGAEYDGVRCYKIPAPEAGIRLLRLVHPRLVSLWRALGRVNADVYHVRSASWLAGVVAVFCRRRNRRSLYAGASDFDFVPGRQSIAHARERWLFEYGLRHVDSIVVQTRSQYGNCRSNYAREASLIPTCYAPPPDAAAHRAGTVLWVSTIQPGKRPEVFLELALKLPGRRFVMIGGPGGPDAASRAYFESIRAAARELGNVEFLGFQPLATADAYFNQARVFVHTSHAGGFPNAFLQAWARGVPSVAFIDTALLDGEAPVYKVACGVEDMGEELERLMADDPYWEEASARCRGYFRERHSVEVATRRYGKLLTNLLPAFRM